MCDGDLLLLAVLRSKGKDETCILSLVDWIKEHIPATGTVRLKAMLRVRGAEVVVSRYLSRWDGTNTPIPTDAVQVFIQKKRGDKCEGSKGCTWTPDDKDFCAVLRNLFRGL